MALFFPVMIADIAQEAGIKTPDFSQKADDFDADEYPHFFVFCEVTLGRAIDAGRWSTWAEHNARAW